ncbi:MAG: hypothetical protein LUG18_09280 [Candidatus Azobacteroides sp.]|nr:hypothetical protein [Candidatus Azobacteroides sp.]
MNLPVRQYTKEMYRKFGYFATWMPGIPIELGDVGTIENNIFTKFTDLQSEALKIEFKSKTKENKDFIEYKSEGQVNLSVKFAGTLPRPGSKLTEADAGIMFDFKKANSVYFRAKDVSFLQIDDLLDLQQKLLQPDIRKIWKKNWVIVTQVVCAEALAVMLSNKKDATVELKANANISAIKPDILDAGFEFTTRNDSGMETSYLSENRTSPLFKVHMLKKEELKDQADGQRRESFYMKEVIYQ